MKGSSSTGLTTEERVIIGRSASEKEKTKMRERHRRAVTTKIFHGLRKHGGYNLPPRADINDVLRELAKEAGWVVEPDGTTYRNPSSSSSITNTNVPHLHSCCPTCVAGKSSGTPTPTSSFGGGGNGGDCSTTASPRYFPCTDASAASLYFSTGGASSRDLTPDGDGPLAVYFGMPFGGLATCTGTGGGGGGFHLSSVTNSIPASVMMPPYQQLFFQEARASNDLNQDTPVGSPKRRT